MRVSAGGERLIKLFVLASESRECVPRLRRGLLVTLNIQSSRTRLATDTTVTRMHRRHDCHLNAPQHQQPPDKQKTGHYFYFYY